MEKRLYNPVGGKVRRCFLYEFDEFKFFNPNK